MRWYPSRPRRPRPSLRPVSAGSRRSCRLGLIPLEDRVLPGDSFLALLLADGIIPERGFQSLEAGLAATSLAPANPHFLAVAPAQSVAWYETAAGSLPANAGGSAASEAGNDLPGTRLFAGDPLPSDFLSDPVPSWGTEAARSGVNRPSGLGASDSVVVSPLSGGTTREQQTGTLDARPPVPASASSGAFALPSGESLSLAILYGLGGGSGTGGPGPAAPSHLGVTAWGLAQNDLVWTDNSNNEDGFRIQRSADGLFFDPLAVVGPDVTTYSDTSPLAGLNYYRVMAFNTGGDSAFSNNLRIDPAAAATTFDRSGGFDNTSGLQLNGSTFHDSINRLVELTDGGGNEAGTFFWTSRVGVTSFTTTFTFQIHGGSNPRADGMAFIVQANDPSAIGPAGGGLAYGPDNPAGTGGIPNSAAVKFDIYNNSGEGNNSTGLFTEGRSPTVRAGTAPPVAPDRTDPLNQGEIDLHSARVFEATIAYTGTRLGVSIRDTVSGLRAARIYTVNLSQFVGANTAFVGFGGGTGGLTALQDIRTWRFDALATPVLGPLAPTYLGVTAVSQAQIDLIWEDNSNDETDFRVERSTDGTTFAPLATVGANTTTYSDTSPLAGLNYYRVVAVNAGGESPFSNRLRIDPDTVPTFFQGLNRSGGFDNAGGLTLNANAAYNAPGRLIRLTDQLNDQRGTFFWNDRVPLGRFATSFAFQIHGGTAPRADGMAFIIQANSPTALGNGGGDLGYGGLANSAAVKLDIYNNAGEGTNSTGIFTEGRSPFTRQAGLPPVVPDQSIPLDLGIIDLNSARVFRADISYDGTTVRVVLTDTVSSATATQTYTVNLSRFLGGNTAWVGFGGGTGGLNAIHDVRTWSFYSKP